MKHPSLLRVAIIGLGNMGKNHVRHAHLLPEIEVVAVCDTDPGRIAAAQTVIPGVPGFTQVEALLASVAIDLAIVVVPTSLHERVASQVLSAGVHVLLEKPIAGTVTEADRVIALAEHHQKRVFVGHVEFFNPAFQAFLAYSKAEAFGGIRHVAVRRWSPMPLQITDADVVVDLAIHDLHAISQILLSDPLSVSWTSLSHVLPDRVDASVGVLHFPDAVATVDVNWISSAKVRDMEIVSSQGVAKVDFLHQTVSISRLTHPEWMSLPVQKVWPLETELTHVSRALQTGSPSPIDAVHGRRVLAWCRNF